MKTDAANPQTMDGYIAGFPPDVRAILERIRATIAQAAPEAEEAIKYRLPTFVLDGNLVHFGAFKRHIGFYATASGHEAFRKELSAYTGAKGSVKFPLNQPMPLELMGRMVKFRVAENRARAAAKRRK